MKRPIRPAERLGRARALARRRAIIPIMTSDPQRALSVYRRLASAQPEQILSMLAAQTQRFEDPSCALDALDDCGAHLCEGLSRRPSESARRSATEIAAMCAFDGPESLKRLGKALPSFWKDLCIDSTVFSSISEAALESWSPEQTRLAADMSSRWIGDGLRPDAWIALANLGGPAWRMFRDRHARDMRADSLPEPSRAGELTWRGAARLAKSFGWSGYGQHGHWISCIQERPEASDRLGAIHGMLSLLNESASQAPPPSRSNPFLGEAISKAVALAESDPFWARFATLSLDRATRLGIDADAIRCPIPHGLSWPADLRIQLLSRNNGQALGPPETCSPSHLLCMSKCPDLREKAASLGADFDVAGALFVNQSTRALQAYCAHQIDPPHVANILKTSQTLRKLSEESAWFAERASAAIEAHALDISTWRGAPTPSKSTPSPRL